MWFRAVILDSSRYGADVQFGLSLIFSPPVHCREGDLESRPFAFCNNLLSLRNAKDLLITFRSNNNLNFPDRASVCLCRYCFTNKQGSTFGLDHVVRVSIPCEPTLDPRRDVFINHHYIIIVVSFLLTETSVYLFISSFVSLKTRMIKIN